jgi:hypothetical protein
MNVIINRIEFEENQTLGQLIVMDGLKLVFQCKTLELPWRDNKQMISCIPPGCYPLVLEWSPRFEANLWEIYKVPNRSECKFHVANYVRQLNGCIALGDMHLDLDGDGKRDLRSSAKTLGRFHDVLRGHPYLQITEL